MRRKLCNVLVLAVLVLTLVACGRAEASPTLATGETAALRGGGGGWISSNGQFTEGLVVIGTGTASAEPQVALVDFGVELRGDDPAAIVDEAAQKIDRAIAAAQETGIAAEDIVTTGYNLWAETIYDPEKGTPTGEVVYHLSHYVEAKLHDLTRVGDLLAAVVGAGANTISGVSFTVDDPETLVGQARQQALADAATRAQQMAEGLNVTLGKPILVTEAGGSYPLPMERGGVGGGGVMPETAPSISPGAFSVSVSIQVVYEIQ